MRMKTENNTHNLGKKERTYRRNWGRWRNKTGETCGEHTQIEPRNILILPNSFGHNFFCLFFQLEGMNYEQCFRNIVFFGNLVVRNFEAHQTNIELFFPFKKNKKILNCFSWGISFWTKWSGRVGSTLVTNFNVQLCKWAGWVLRNNRRRRC